MAGGLLADLDECGELFRLLAALDECRGFFLCLPLADLDECGELFLVIVFIAILKQELAVFYNDPAIELNGWLSEDRIHVNIGLDKPAQRSARAESKMGCA